MGNIDKHTGNSDTTIHDKRGFLMGNVCILTATIFWGINVSATKALIPEWMFAALPTLFLVPQLLHQPILHTTEAVPWLEISFILLCPTFAAYFLVQPAIRHIGSELVSLYQYLVPVFATVSAVLMGLSHLKWIQALAMLVIVGGMVITNVGKLRKKPIPAS